MAMWDLNCQSNPSSADDKELAPYLARQKAMREFFERALFAPKDQGNNGLYFLGATTGSGKNYTAEQVTADLIAGGWDAANSGGQRDADDGLNGLAEDIRRMNETLQRRL